MEALMMKLYSAPAHAFAAGSLGALQRAKAIEAADL
jgi:hypothetical protein